MWATTCGSTDKGTWAMLSEHPYQPDKPRPHRHQVQRHSVHLSPICRQSRLEMNWLEIYVMFTHCIGTIKKDPDADYVKWYKTIKRSSCPGTSSGTTTSSPSWRSLPSSSSPSSSLPSSMHFLDTQLKRCSEHNFFRDYILSCPGYRM